MTFIITLLILLLISTKFSNQIRKYATSIYIITVIISILSIVLIKGQISNEYIYFLNKYVIQNITKGTVTLALFTIVMYTGVLEKSKIKGKLMSVRGELSIIACIITLTHNILYGFRYFKFLFIQPGEMKLNVFIATIISLIMIIMMIPLMITSFKRVRKKMKFKTWKRIQKMAYPFYGLMYVHIMLLYMPHIQSKYSVIVIYTIVFLTYAVLRIGKHFKDTKRKKALVK